MRKATRPRVRRVAGFGLTTPDAARLSSFYAAAFGCACGPPTRLGDSEVARLLGVRGGAWRRRLSIGGDSIELLQFDTPGELYPACSAPVGPLFQHFALTVADVSVALQRLRQVAGWTPLSSAGPVHLPQRSGGVTAFKFRDPDGHPLELLQFHAPSRRPHPAERAPATVLGIDHSAIGVEDTARSIAFYAGFGFSVTAQSHNVGAEQSLLDGFAGADVMVTALTPLMATPHVELLCYRTQDAQEPCARAANDVAATRLLLEVDAAPAGTASAAPDDAAVASPSDANLIVDPDGHRLCVQAADRAG